MSDRTPPGSDRNVNVTLPEDSTEPRRTFPCPLCATGLDVRESRARKPYCVCTSCGVQIFFRGKTGISRLRRLIDEHERLLGGSSSIAPPAIALFNRVEQLRAHRHDLQERRPFILTDEDLEHAIAAVDVELARVQETLARMSTSSKS